MKKLALSIAFLGIFGMVHAQRQNTYFFKKDGRLVKERDSADYIEVVQEPDSGQVYYKINDYYLDGTKKFTATATKLNPMVYEGDFTTFDKKGKKLYEATYLKGEPVGKASYYFSDGTLKNQLEYYKGTNDKGEKETKSKFIYLADSLGHVMVKGGNGHFTTTNKEEGDEYTEEGNYKDGLRTGEWTLKSKSGKYWYKEIFSKDKLIKGESFRKGKNYQYTVEGEEAEFNGGLSAFYAYIGRSVRYPADASRAGIMGKVFVSFVVGSDGKVIEVKVMRPVYPSLDKEAIRVIRASPEWTPGKRHGHPVRMLYNVPITFNLQ